NIDPNQYLIHQQGETFFLSKKEFNLLYLLASNPSRIFSRSELITQVWEQDVLVLPRTLDVHIRKIRQKIGSQFIETVTGKGYQFVPQTTVQFAL
ncbi:MAG: winged helix-turn-helix domain-containing protein, partial [Bacteroidota bacterium]